LSADLFFSGHHRTRINESGGNRKPEKDDVRNVAACAAVMAAVIVYSLSVPVFIQ
jgi:hypothetical protein